jgi:hypothetical protein
MLQRAALYFLGGPDDREALAYAAGMAGTLSSLTVVRFKLRDWVEMGGRDEEMLQDFWTRHRDNERVVYVEKTVDDGEGTASVVRSMSEKFDLLIVGRSGGHPPAGSPSGAASAQSWACWATCSPPGSPSSSSSSSRPKTPSAPATTITSFVLSTILYSTFSCPRRGRS